MVAPTHIPPPNSRRLRIFSFDPALASQYDAGGIGEITIKVPWEANPLQPGPVGEYIEVVDIDPASGLFYHPVDLDNPQLLAQDGLAPSETKPQFHQQMVYAVAMTTIGHFERALGRVALWASHRVTTPDYIDDKFVRRLRIYPHALRDRNAYYSPAKKALLFGYFPVTVKDQHNTPGTIVYTCLSHDIIAHETTHALLDGVHPRFNEPVNADVLAFHEAFADIVALFQHFSYPGVLHDQIARSRGAILSDSLLPQLAQQFGRATGRGKALRNALGAEPNTAILEKTFGPHDRGAILVAAVFGAFMKVYKGRTRDLYRIATEGTGVLKDGDIHPDLATRLAEEANRAAMYVLLMCIRAIDYCPPVGITFGDYLRAVITADTDINPDDEFGYRLAFVESFRQWGIAPRNMRSMSEESLLWPTGEAELLEAGIAIDHSMVESLIKTQQDTTDAAQAPSRRSQSPRGMQALETWSLDSDRFATWNGIEKNSNVLWAWLVKGAGRPLANAIGIVLQEVPGQPLPHTISRSSKDYSLPAIEIHSVRWAQRRSPRGGTVTDLVVEITQKRRGYADEAVQAKMDQRPRATGDPESDFTYRAGCTLLIDPQKMTVRRVIKTPGTITNETEFQRLRAFLYDGGLEPGNAYALAASALHTREPFALLHRHGD